MRAAVEDQVIRQDLDYRSRVLIRDSIKALRHHWGDERVENWLMGSPVGEQIAAIDRGPWDDDRGFSSLIRRVVDALTPQTIERFFRDLSRHVRRPLRLAVGGSAALIVLGYLARPTEDVDVVDEVPKELREQHALLSELKERYGLELAHFQQHYRPMRWQSGVLRS